MSELEELERVKALRGVRVEAGEVIGVLHGVLENVQPGWCTVFLDSEEMGHTQFDISMDEVRAYQHVCEKCHDAVNRVFDGLCADCRREVIRRAGTTGRCGVCGTAGGYRNPSDPSGAYKCSECHEEDGTAALGKVSLAGACAGLDLDDPAHVWRLVRGSRGRCVGCGTDRWGG